MQRRNQALRLTVGAFEEKEFVESVERLDAGPFETLAIDLYDIPRLGEVEAETKAGTQHGARRGVEERFEARLDGIAKLVSHQGEFWNARRRG